MTTKASELIQVDPWDYFLDEDSPAQEHVEMFREIFGLICVGNYAPNSVTSWERARNLTGLRQEGLCSITRQR